MRHAVKRPEARLPAIISAAWPSRNTASACNATIWIYYWIYGGICHEYHAAETSAEALPEAPQATRDGPVRGSWARRRSRVDPVARKAARRRWPRFGAHSRHCPPYHFGGTVEKGRYSQCITPVASGRRRSGSEPPADSWPQG